MGSLVKRLISLIKDMEVKAKKGEELSVHVDPLHTSVICHGMARPPPQPLNTYNLAKPDLAKRSQTPADGAG